MAQTARQYVSGFKFENYVTSGEPLQLNKILVVDDNAPFRQIVIAMLGRLAKQYVECDDGREAVKAYAAHLPEVVVMDLEMKELDGLEATKQIKESFPAARILMFSQHDDPDVIAESQAAGACHYLLKDDLLNLEQTIQELLNPRNNRSPQSTGTTQLDRTIRVKKP